MLMVIVAADSEERQLKDTLKALFLAKVAVFASFAIVAPISFEYKETHYHLVSSWVDQFEIFLPFQIAGLGVEHVSFASHMF